MAKYKQISVFIVQSVIDGHIERVFGIKEDADNFLTVIETSGEYGFRVNEWPIEIKQ